MGRKTSRLPFFVLYRGQNEEKPLIPLQYPSRLDRFRTRLLPTALLLLPLLLLPGCSDNDPNLSYSYVRGASDFKVDTAGAGALCDDPGPYFKSEGFDPKETCRKIQKLKLTWERPDDYEDFRSYMLYLDTTPLSRKDWKRVQNEDGEAALAVLDGRERIEQIIFLYDHDNPPEGIEPRDAPDTVREGQRHIIGIDTAGRLEDSTSRFVFALATRYGRDKTPGQPQYSWIITGDKDPPRAFAPRILGADRRLEISWARPNDPTSFFDPQLDTGLIAEYRLAVRLSGADRKSRSERFKPVLEYRRGGVRREEGVADSLIKDPAGVVIGREWILPDVARARRGDPGPEDSLEVIVSGLHPSEVFDVRLYAVDSAGNTNLRTMSSFTTVRITDTTRPPTPDLEVIDSLTGPNAFTLRWGEIRDSTDTDGDGDLEPGPTPNDGIESYRLSRTLIPRTAADSGHLDRRDTVIRVEDAGDTTAVFRVTEGFLPPGKEYLIRLFAVDTSGFPSHEDSLRVATSPIRFTGADSALACPPGFIPIPRARFTLGDANASVQQADERGKAVTMAAFCIEPYEHRGADGKFVTKVTWEEAQAACEEISEAHGTALCTEAEWERACEGFDISSPHLHGIQSERDPAILQTRCNQGVGDVAMAMSLDLRDPVCLTNEGVYDMAGNLSEWVRDVYSDSAYRNLGDTLGHDDVARAAAGRPNAVRGSSFLVPSRPVSPAALQSLARCNNRDFAMQMRPVFRPDCVGEEPRIAVQYAGSGPASHRCIDIPEDLRGLTFTDVVPTLGDTSGTRITLFEAGTNKAHTAVIPADTAFRGRRPLETRFTTLSVAEVIFERVGNPDEFLKDTLETREMRDTSQAVLETILRRESPSAAWRPRKDGDRYYVRRLYAYATLGSKDGREHYASPSLGFRCCARPLPAPAQVLAVP